jgi:hypothetical protein
MAFATANNLPVGEIKSTVRVPADFRHFTSIANRAMRGDVWLVTFWHIEVTPGEITSNPFVFVHVEDDNGEVSGWRH